MRSRRYRQQLGDALKYSERDNLCIAQGHKPSVNTSHTDFDHRWTAFFCDQYGCLQFMAFSTNSVTFTLSCAIQINSPRHASMNYYPQTALSWTQIGKWIVAEVPEPWTLSPPLGADPTPV